MISDSLFLHEWKNIFDVHIFMLGGLLHSFIPKVDPKEFCDAWKLCSVREHEGEYMVAVKYLDGTTTEIPLKDVVYADQYLGDPILRTYSSGYVFLNDDRESVYLLTTEKNGMIQHQFTGGSPIEEGFSNIIYKAEDKIKINLYKVEDNADQRTFIRTGVKVLDTYNDMPLVDRALMERIDEQGKKYWRIVLLMHYVVKSYDGNLKFCEGQENIIGGDRYRIDDLLTTPNIAPNAYLISNKAREMIKNS